MDKQAAYEKRCEIVSSFKFLLDQCVTVARKAAELAGASGGLFVRRNNRKEEIMASSTIMLSLGELSGETGVIVFAYEERFVGAVDELVAFIESLPGAKP